MEACRGSRLWLAVGWNLLSLYDSIYLYAEHVLGPLYACTSIVLYSIIYLHALPAWTQAEYAWPICCRDGQGGGQILCVSYVSGGEVCIG